MDSKEKAAKLEKQIAELQTKRRATEGRLDQEHQLVRRATAERGSLVESLIRLEGDEARRVHQKVDGLDAAIRTSERLAEGLQKSLARATQEIEALQSELAEIQRSIAAQETEVAYRKWESEIVREFRAASETLGQARVALASVQAAAVKGANDFGGRAQVLLAGMFTDFITREANPELRFRPARPIHEMTAFRVEPMVPKEAAAAGR